jgi:magnesium chelatase family protein
LQVCDFVQGASNVTQLVHKLTDKQTIYNNDFSQVKGQYHAKRALEIAAQYTFMSKRYFTRSGN